MTIDEAIEVLEAIKAEMDYDWLESEDSALKLGIEALKQYEQMKDTGEIWSFFRLPGETP